MDDNSKPLEEREKWEPEFKKIISQLNDLLSQIGSVRPDEVLHGFKEEN